MQMPRIVVSEFVSLDGVMEDPGGSEGSKHAGWTFKFPDPEGGRYKLDETLGADSLLLGRVTYEGFAEAWPGRTDDAGFADKMNSMPKYVVSTTLENPEWNNSTVIAFDQIEALKEQQGGDMLVAGSAKLARSLHDAGLIDEYRLMVFPIVLGSGLRLFGEHDDATTLKLVDSKALASGTVILTYHAAGEA
jgi:dihydrofolate reductase